ncbi:hypothetical protein HU200_055475 [Digitaria exilis]|uniref:Uncharacterized protein n=1 Tax=Digitaria exilis TaxID=1010633 RepID=A0A835ADH6_9POAL|nr:hypothetical protein HU200_055475 [Digitaria exilis]
MGMQHLAAAAGGLGDAASMDAGADKLHQAGLLGIVTSSMAVTLAVRDPPAGLNTNAYYLALTGAFFGGVAGITAAACLSNNPRARTSAGRKLMWASVVGSLAVVVGLSAAASLLW